MSTCNVPQAAEILKVHENRVMQLILLWRAVRGQRKLGRLLVAGFSPSHRLAARM